MSEDLEVLVEVLAKNNHDIWAEDLLSKGWKYSTNYDDPKTSKLLLPFELLSIEDKKSERNLANEIVKYILSNDYRLERNRNYNKNLMENIQVDNFEFGDDIVINSYKQQLFNVYLRTCGRLGKSELIQVILSSNDIYVPDINSADCYGQNALYLAVKRGNKETVEVLLKLGAQINIQDKNGLSPLMVAAFLGNHEICQILLSNGADLKLKDSRNYTAL